MSSTKALAPYTGSSPGADSNTYTLYDSSSGQKRYVRGYAFEYLHVRMRNNAAGTIKAYFSRDGGSNWIQFDQRTVFASTATNANRYWFHVGPYKDVKIDFVNGGSAQTTFTVDVELSDGQFTLPENSVLALPGGFQEDSLTTTEVYCDLSTLARYEVLIWSDVDIYFSAHTTNSGTLVISGDSAASTTSLKADRAAANIGKRRVIHPAYPYLVVRTVSGSGTLHVKPVRLPSGAI